MLDDPSMKHLHWRWLLIVGALPSVVGTFMAAAFLNESPSWLASRGKEEEAREVLVKMNRMNGNHCARLEFSAPLEEPNRSGYADMKRDLGIIFGSTMLYTTLVCCFNCFCLNFLYYGGLYVFPQVLSGSVKTGTSPALAMLMGALWEAPGYILALGFDRVMDRRPTMIVTLLTLTTCVLGFVYGGSHQPEGRLQYLMVHVGFAGYKCVASIIFLFALQYCVEIYPVSCRVAGTRLSVGVGRMGAIISPPAYEWTTAFFGTWTTFFYILACFLVLNAILVAFLPFETRGKPLRDSMEDSHETDPLCQSTERTKQI